MGTINGYEWIERAYTLLDDEFTSIYDQYGYVANQLPETDRITVFCEYGNGEGGGFAIDVVSEDLGIEALIAKKWILHKDIVRLIGEYDDDDD